MIQLISIIIVLLIIFQVKKKYELLKNYNGKLVSEEYELGEVVDEELFWSEIGNNYSINYNEQLKLIADSLTKKSKEEIIRFRNTFDLLMIHSYDSNLWEKAYAINFGCSDDSFEYFRSWVISQGKDKFYNTLSDPNYLIYFAKKEIFQNYEGLHYVADEVADLKGFSIARNSQLPGYELKGNANIESGVFKNFGMSIATLFN